MLSDSLRKHMHPTARSSIFRQDSVQERKDGNIQDLEWHKSFITKAVQHKRDIVPAFFSGRNSNFFYNLSNFRKFAWDKSKY
ncbi:MAG: hypothetical protein MZV63_29070 [Marinilabiliales bacterium]|nr:hypothetical protein [Marinilabiliales bacterium]